MNYIIRSVNGTVLFLGEEERTFTSKQEALSCLATLESSTEEEWKLIQLLEKES